MTDTRPATVDGAAHSIPCADRNATLINDDSSTQEGLNVRHKTHAEENFPDRFELFILDDGQQKIEVREETSTYPVSSLFCVLPTFSILILL